MCEFARLKIHEIARVNQTLLDELTREMGMANAERFIGHLFDELGEALGDIDAAYRAGDVERIVARVEPLAEPCERIGLSALSASARAVVATGRAGDAAAFAATVARLIRLVEGSLTAACEAPDMIV